MLKKLTIVIRHNGKVVKHPVQVHMSPRQEARAIMEEEKARDKEEKRLVCEHAKAKINAAKKWALKLGMIKKR
jgi:hypothetical protein